MWWSWFKAMVFAANTCMFGGVVWMGLNEKISGVLYVDPTPSEVVRTMVVLILLSCANLVCFIHELLEGE